MNDNSNTKTRDDGSTSTQTAAVTQNVSPEVSELLNNPAKLREQFNALRAAIEQARAAGAPPFVCSYGLMLVDQLAAAADNPESELSISNAKSNSVMLKGFVTLKSLPEFGEDYENILKPIVQAVGIIVDIPLAY